MAERNTAAGLTIADPSHLPLFQDGGHIPPVTSPRAACKRFINFIAQNSYVFRDIYFQCQICVKSGIKKCAFSSGVK